jgi:PKD repeat protein
MSSDTGGSITKYEWDWNNDGIYEDSLTASITTHTWAQEGSYPVILKVTDNDGLTDTTTTTITVGSESTNPPPDTSTKTPGFELIFLLCAIAVSILIWKKKRNK